MYRKPIFRFLPLLFLISMLALTGCGLVTQPVTRSGTAPTPVVSYGKGGVDNPDVFVDPEAFRAALLQALYARDTARLQMWMTEPFLTGTWRADLSDTPPADALKAILDEELTAGSTLTLVKSADLKALMGGTDPLTIPRADAEVVEAFLVSGWGKDGRDEAILFVARQANNSLMWHGWMQVKGGFSGARLGGSLPYQNDAHGYSLYLPKNFQVETPINN